MADSNSGTVSAGAVGLGFKSLLPALPILVAAGVVLVGLPVWAQQPAMGELALLTGAPRWLAAIPVGILVGVCKGLFWGVVALQLAPRLGLTGFVRPGGRQGGWLGWGLCLMVAALLQYLAILVGTLLLVFPGVILGCMLFLTLPAAALEQVGPLEALSRSRALTQDNRLAIFGVQLLIGAPLFIANIAALLIIGARAGAGLTAGMTSPLYLQGYAPVAGVIYNLAIASAAVAIYARRVLTGSAGASAVAQVFD